MRMSCAVVVASALILSGGVSSDLAGQAEKGPQPMVGTWTLVSMERSERGQPLARVPNALGILIQDATGHVLEAVTRSGRAASVSSTLTPQDFLEEFINYNAFWGTYKIDDRLSTATYRRTGDLNPNRMGLEFVRSYERKGTQLTLTESAPDRRPISRSVWEHAPELEALPAYQRDAVGFWEWQSAALFDLNGVMVQPAHRDSSVIVYTPTGHMAVIYLPPPGRKKFVGEVPTAEEARAAIEGCACYFGTYAIQPKSGYVTHYQAGSLSAAGAGRSQSRFFEVKGPLLTLRFPPTTLNGQPVRNIVNLKRLSGLMEMWPDFRD